ncbi:uncharacterized protein LOC119395679 [Rhipicephalus sanguineus]|uniref:uncharacterized protein LOC119395679 n=1 Tax=Rhipicephalus sanguineus TaxID=34632 RepID=UPI0020C42D6A|nr:uncharacterized protein LOC119395679 [Rhipicephalus sanguineus]
MRPQEAMEAVPRRTTVVLLTLLYVSSSINPTADAAPAKKEVNIIDLLFKFGNLRELRTVMGNAAVGVVSPKACSVCRATTSLFIDYLESGRSKEGLARIARGACAFLKIASAAACTNVIDMYKDELFYIAENRKAPTAETCSVLFGSLCGPLTSEVHNWTIQIRAPSMSRAHVDDQHERCLPFYAI